MINHPDQELNTFFAFTPEQWATFKHRQDRLMLSPEQIAHCLAFNDKISVEDVQNIYLPLSRLLYLYFKSRHERSAVIQQFLGRSMEDSPFIISISGSVSVGKTTTARLLRELLRTWPCGPKVDLITTDGYLYPNRILEQKNIMAQKGFPVSYDVKRLMKFLFELKNGKPQLKVPEYSHLTYDVLPDQYQIVDRPDILIIEGVNVLQNGADYPDIHNRVFISDFIDFSIYVDASEEHLITWYIDRFLKLREKTFDDPKSYFHRYAHMPEPEAVSLAKLIWQSVNHVNLVQNILPCRNRASLVLRKGPNHRIERVYLRK